MNASVKDLRTEFDALTARRNAIDIATLQAAHAEAKEALTAHQPLPNHMLDPEENRLSNAVSQAKSQFDAAKADIASVDRLMQPLAQMLSAADRLATHGADATTMAERMDAARAVAEEAQTTVTTLAGMLADLTATHAQESEAAAKALVVAAKGGKAAKFTAPDRSRLDATEAAMALAQGELDEAQAAYTDAVAAHAETLRLLELAKADGQELVFELQFRDFAAACVQQRRVFPGWEPLPEDLMTRVYRLEDDPK